MNRPLHTVALVVALGAGCGGQLAPDTPRADRVTEVGEITVLAGVDNEAATSLVVDYAAAYITVCDSQPATQDGTLVFFGAFNQGQIKNGLDLATVSLSIDLNELPDARGPVDITLDADAVNVYFEWSDYEGSRLEAGSNVDGRLYLRYDAPPRPGITIQGTFSLVIPAVETEMGELAALTLEGVFEIPVVRSC